ncbi:hypothetical protein N9B10_02305 [Pirellulales bacterium]|nr:hypothetical protein [Pirellulales bacterium]
MVGTGRKSGQTGNNGRNNNGWGYIDARPMPRDHFGNAKTAGNSFRTLKNVGNLPVQDFQTITTGDFVLPFGDTKSHVCCQKTKTFSEKLLSISNPGRWLYCVYPRAEPFLWITCLLA